MIQYFSLQLGKTAIHYATELNDFHTITLLAKFYKADVNIQDNVCCRTKVLVLLFLTVFYIFGIFVFILQEFKTALHYACEKQLPESVERLLDIDDINVNITDKVYHFHSVLLYFCFVDSMILLYLLGQENTTRLCNRCEK